MKKVEPLGAHRDVQTRSCTKSTISWLFFLIDVGGLLHRRRKIAASEEKCQGAAVKVDDLLVNLHFIRRRLDSG